jgi:hypothetical protein
MAAFFVEHYCGKCTRENTAALLPQPWHEPLDAALVAGWDIGESTAEDDDESDSSDDSFELRMPGESGNKAFLEMRKNRHVTTRIKKKIMNRIIRWLATNTQNPFQSASFPSVSQNWF